DVARGVVFPENAALAAARDERFAIRRPGDVDEVLAEAPEDAERLAAARVPQANGGVETPRGCDGIPIRRPRKAVDIAVVADERAEQFAVFEVPDANRSVEAAGGNAFAFRTQRHGDDVAAMPAVFQTPTGEAANGGRFRDQRPTAQRRACGERD